MWCLLVVREVGVHPLRRATTKESQADSSFDCPPFLLLLELALVTIHCCEVMGPAQKIRFCTVDGVRWSLEMDHVHRCITSYSSIPAKWGRVRWHFDNRNVSMWGMVDGGLFFATTVTTRSPFPYFTSSAPPPCPPRDDVDSDLMEPCTRFARSSVGG